MGVNVFVGRTSCPLYTVTAVLAYMTQRGSAAGPLFQFRDGRPLTRQRFVAEVKEALKLAGIDISKCSGHSFRSGAATTAVRRGVQGTRQNFPGCWWGVLKASSRESGLVISCCMVSTQGWELEGAKSEG